MKESARAECRNARVYAPRSAAPLGDTSRQDGRNALTIDPVKVIGAGLIGIIAAFAAELGATAAGGEPITEMGVWANTVTGALGGMTGEIILELGGNALSVAVVAPFVTGFFFQLLFPPVPVPPFATAEPTA